MNKEQEICLQNKTFNQSRDRSCINSSFPRVVLIVLNCYKPAPKNPSITKFITLIADRFVFRFAYREIQRHSALVHWAQFQLISKEKQGRKKTSSVRIPLIITSRQLSLFSVSAIFSHSPLPLARQSLGVIHVQLFHPTDKKRRSFENRQKQKDFFQKFFSFRLSFCSLAGF